MDDYALYGYSLFETLIVRDGQFRLLDYHWYRLTSSARVLGLESPGWDEWLDLLAKAPQQGSHVVRVTLLRQGGRWRNKPSSTTIDLRHRPLESSLSAPRLMTAKHALPVDDRLRCFKSGNRLRYQLLWEAAQTRGFDDVLLFDQRGNLLETSISNVYVRLKGEWFTPPLEQGVLPGTTRGYLIDEKVCRIGELSLDVLGQAEALAVSNAAAGCLAVGLLQHDGRDYTWEQGFKSVTRLTKTLQSARCLPLEDWRKRLPTKDFRPWALPGL